MDMKDADMEEQVENESSCSMTEESDFPMGDDDADMSDVGDMEDSENMDEPEMVECEKDQLMKALEEVASGEKTPDEVMDELCETVGEDETEEEDEDEMPAGLKSSDFGVSPEDNLQESISRIARLITEDPDIMNL